MKTPREILLQRHQAASTKLDHTRRIFVADLSPGSVLGCVNSEINAKTQRRKDAEAEGARVGSQIERLELQLPESALAPQETSSLGVFASLRLCAERLPQKLWRELVWPCRRTWAGLAAVWVMLMAFNLANTDRSQIVVAKSTTRPEEMRLAFQEQQRVLEEILGPTPPASSTEPPRRPNPQPRSERRIEFLMV